MIFHLVLCEITKHRARRRHLLTLQNPNDERHTFLYNITLVPRNATLPRKAKSVTYVSTIK